MAAHAGKARNVHHAVLSRAPGGSRPISAVRGDYIYFHYLQDGVNDDGWGCAYRSLQTLYSWFLLQGFADRPVPSIAEIQKLLVDMGDKPPAFIGTLASPGSTDWIGSFELSYVLNKLVGIDSVILNIPSGDQVGSKVAEFRRHFEVYGTPIMIGRPF